MDITDIIIELEKIDDKTERCLACSNLIHHSKFIKDSIGFQDSTNKLIDSINKMTLQRFRDTIDENVKELTKYLSVIINY